MVGTWADAAEVWADTDTYWAPPIYPAAGAPTAKVEIEFTTSTWTNVTAYWDAKRPVTITGGRADTDDRVQPGRLSGLWLDNTDGRFTVGNASGAYYPNVATGKRIRLSIKDPSSSTYHPRFTGRIDGWPLSWDNNGTTCWVSLSATDLLNDWAVADMPVDWMYRATVDLGALAYWEGHTLTYAGAIPARIGGGDLVNLGAAPTTPSVDGPPGDPRRLPEFTYGSTASVYRGLAPTIPTNGWAITAWVRITSDPPSTGYYPVVVEQAVSVPPGNRVAIRVKADQVYASTISSGSVVTDRAASGVDICDGSWHLVMVYVNDAGGGLGSIGISVDGANVSTGSISTSTLLCDSTITRTVALGTTTAGAVGHVALWDASEPTVQDAAAPGHGLDINTVSARLAQIASLAGLTSPTVQGDARVYMTSSSPLGKALDLVRLVEDTDGGVFWCNGSGTAIYNASLSRTTTPTLALTLTASEVDAALNVAADRVGIANKVTVTNTAPLNAWRPDPTMQQVVRTDAASVTAMGPRPRELATATLPTNEGHLSTRASELMATTEAPRISELPVDVMALPSAQQLAVLTSEVWDQIAVTGLPAAGGFDTNWLGRIEGWTETVGIDTWVIQFATSFAGNRLGDLTHGLILGSNRLG